MSQDAELTLIMGQRGCGKTTVAKALVKSERRVIAFDTMGEFAQMRGWKVAHDRKAVAQAMVKAGRGGFKIAYVPPAGQEIDALHFLSEIIWRYQEAAAEQITLLVDEADLGIPKHNLPANRGGVKQLILRGRHRGVNMIACTQRPALISSSYISNSAHIYGFMVASTGDIDQLVRTFGRQHKAAIEGLQKFQFLYRADGQICTGHTMKSGALKVNSVRT